MQVTYKASVFRDPFGSFIAVFDDVLDAVGMGESKEQALEDAAEGLQIALESRLKAGLSLPFPRAACGRDIIVALPDDASPALKICA